MAHHIRVGGGGSIIVVLEDFDEVKNKQELKKLPQYAKTKGARVFRAKNKHRVMDMGGVCIFHEDRGNSALCERHLSFAVIR